MDNPELSEIEETLRADEEELIKDVGETLKHRISENNGQFTETIPIKPDSSLDLTDSQGNLRSYFVHIANASGNEAVEELYKLASKVQGKFPEIKFTFERDIEGKSIAYTVAEGTNK